MAKKKDELEEVKKKAEKDKENLEKMEKARKDPEFFEKQLYWTPDRPPYDFFIRYHNWQLAMLVEFFKEVFEERAFIEGYQPNNKYYRVILAKAKHDRPQ